MPGRFQQKRKMKKRMYSWWSVALLSIVALFFLNNTWDVYKKYTESKRNVFGLHDRYEETKLRETELRQKIAHLNSEHGLEEEIREKFNVAKKGEQVIVIVDPKVEEGQQEVETPNAIEGLWEKMLELFR